MGWFFTPIVNMGRAFYLVLQALFSEDYWLVGGSEIGAEWVTYSRGGAMAGVSSRFPRETNVTMEFPVMFA